MIKRYEVVIKGAIGESDRTIGEQEIKKEQERKSKSNADVTAGGFEKGAKATVGAIASLYASSQLAVQPIMREKVNVAVLSGDIVQAKNMQRINANTNMAINKGMGLLGIGISFGVNVGLGFVALGTTGVKEISNGINRMQNNKMVEAQSEIDNFIGMHDRARMSGLIR